jgi:hypothetical protein
MHHYDRGSRCRLHHSRTAALRRLKGRGRS